MPKNAYFEGYYSAGIPIPASRFGWSPLGANDSTLTNSEVSVNKRQPFYDPTQPPSRRITHEGADRGAPFNPALHLVRLFELAQQAAEHDPDGAFNQIIDDEISAIRELHRDVVVELDR